MPYILKLTDRGAKRQYVAKPGSEHSYTNSLAQAKKFATREAAEAEACENERPVDLRPIIEELMS